MKFPNISASAPLFASLFTGGGGVDAGATSAGFRVCFGVEFNPHDPDLSYEFVQVHKRNFYLYNSQVMLRTVQEVAIAEFPRFPRNLFLLHASPVCSNFSSAKLGGQEEYTDISSAWAVCEAIRLLKPKYFTLENVCAYDKSDAFAMILKCLVDCGYNFHYKNVDMIDYGIPQNRKRLFLLANLHSNRAMLFPPRQSRRGWGEVVDFDQLSGCECDLIEGQKLAIAEYLKYNHVRAVAIERYSISSKSRETGLRKMTIRQDTEPLWTITVSVFNDGKGGGRKKTINVWKDGQAYYLPFSQIKRLCGFPDWYELPEDQPRVSGSILGYCVCPEFYRQLLTANFPAYAKGVSKTW